MNTSVLLQVGDKFLAVAPGFLPPVGTRISVHKHLNDGGFYPLVEVVAHEWRLNEPVEDDALPAFEVTIKTRSAK